MSRTGRDIGPLIEGVLEEGVSSYGVAGVRGRDGGLIPVNDAVRNPSCTDAPLKLVISDRSVPDRDLCVTPSGRRGSRLE